LIQELNKPNIIQFDTIGDQDFGFITVFEFLQNLPFELKRAYWIYQSPLDKTRGNHALKKSRQIVIAIKGIAEIFLENVQGDQFSFTLDKPEKGLYIPNLCWRRISLSEDAVLLCIASTEFDKDDYIRDFEEFKNSYNN